MIECFKSSGGYLEKNEEHEFPEDSDCETESEPADGSVAGDAKVGYEQEWGQKLLPFSRLGHWSRELVIRCLTIPY